MLLNLELCYPMFGSQSAVAPRFPTAFDFFASLSEAAPVFTTTNSPLFPAISRLLDSTAILAFLSVHHPRPIDIKKPSIELAEILWRIGTLDKGAGSEGYSLGSQSRRKDILQPFIIFYSLVQA